MWSVFGGMILGFILEMFQKQYNWLWFLLIPLGCFFIYEARWTHFDWMYPNWLYEL